MRDDIFYYIYCFFVNVQVPAGNRHLSGADSSIPTNAYETYTTWSH